jgi:RpiB/LacA/LacB family sugar-phosphate isomerase
MAEAPTRESAPFPSAAIDSIAVGADHGGFPLKERLAFRLREKGHTVVDCGTDSTEAVDYPDFARAVAERVASGECRWGIVVDGAGIGSAMVANKVPGVRAALCYDVSSARNSREHNHANVLTLGAGLIGEALAWQIVEEWLDTPWGEGRHARRVAMIDALDRDRVGVGGPS